MTVSCLVNPRACHETIYPKTNKTNKVQKIAVIGAGAAGASFAIEAAKSGHSVSLYEASNSIGGQLLHAHKVPGKEEFDELLRYFNAMLKKYNVNVQLNNKVSAQQLKDANYDSIVLATGIKPRKLNIEGIDNDNVLSYEEAFTNPEKIGQQVVIIGAGGIGFDMATFLMHQHAGAQSIDSFNANWGIDATGQNNGSLANQTVIEKTDRNVTLLQRKPGRFGKTLGKTTGWVHQIELQKRGVKTIGDLNYLKIDKAGVHVEQDGKDVLFPADSVIICAGQESNDEFADSLNDFAMVYRIGGVKQALELDAAQAIEDATRLAYELN